MGGCQRSPARQVTNASQPARGSRGWSKASHSRPLASNAAPAASQRPSSGEGCRRHLRRQQSLRRRPWPRPAAGGSFGRCCTAPCLGVLVDEPQLVAAGEEHRMAIDGRRPGQPRLAAPTPRRPLGGGGRRRSCSRGSCARRRTTSPLSSTATDGVVAATRPAGLTGSGSETAAVADGRPRRSAGRRRGSTPRRPTSVPSCQAAAGLTSTPASEVIARSAGPARRRRRPRRRCPSSSRLRPRRARTRCRRPRRRAGPARSVPWPPSSLPGAGGVEACLPCGR